MDNKYWSIVIDAPLREVLAIAGSEGLTFDGHWELGEFVALYQELNNNTHKHANRGHTPNELFMMTDRGRKLSERLAPAGQMSLFEEPVFYTKAPLYMHKTIQPRSSGSDRIVQGRPLASSWDTPIASLVRPLKYPSKVRK